MRIVVPWSGGLDSTAVLLMSLRDNKSDHVVAVTVTSDQIDGNKEKCEKDARERFIHWLQACGENVPVTETIKASFPVAHGEVNQPVMWLCALAPFIEREDVVRFGYHHGDQFFHCREKFERAFYAMLDLHYDKHTVKMELPIEWSSKSLIIKDLLEGARVPPTCVWHCESPNQDGNKFTVCGRCAPCETFSKAWHELYNKTEHPWKDAPREPLVEKKELPKLEVPEKYITKNEVKECSNGQG